MSTLDQARRAKQELARLLGERNGVLGLGVSRDEAGGYAVAVRLAEADPGIPTTVRVPDPDLGEVAVTVHTEVVGTIRPE